ncbi:hypothetical protein [uncultured Ruegeria sp.]|uniref:hypothetical protein n=1 Tax=uncultured Ruegeria sp. TaxID=259304 RepID=UPI00261E0EE4|nr:hypothetical protein [uncultured Ruegeria sp.]
MVVDDRQRGVDLVFVTPNRQLPTTVTMSERRCHELLQAAEEFDFYIVEDDSECDVDYRHSTPLPLQCLDSTGRLIYLGSLPKGLSPGLQLGYLTAPVELVKSTRDCRGMMLRHECRSRTSRRHPRVDINTFIVPPEFQELESRDPDHGNQAKGA